MTTAWQLIAPGGVAGVEKVVIEGTAALREGGVDVVVAVIDERREPRATEAFLEAARDRELPIRLLPSAGRIDPSLLRKLAGELRRDRPDVLHVHGYKAAVYGALACPRSTALFATHHGEGGIDAATALYVRLALLAYRRMHVFAVSEATRDWLTTRGVQEARVEVLPNFLSFSPGDLEGLEEARRPGEPGGLKLVYVGRLSHEKGVDMLLRALVNHDDARATIVGDGPERAALESMAADLDLGARVHFAGHLPDVIHAILGADALVLPSRTEGLPMVLVEALALGVPVLATKVGGIGEVIRDGVDGLLVAPDDVRALSAGVGELRLALASLSANADAGAEALRRRFAPERWASRTIAAYRRR